MSERRAIETVRNLNLHDSTCRPNCLFLGPKVSNYRLVKVNLVNITLS